MRGLVVASFSCIAACSLITPLDDLKGGGEGGVDAMGDNVTQDAPINDAVIDVPLAQCTDAGYTVCGSACVDLRIDHANCGACSHSCLGGQCANGACQPFALATGQAFPQDIAIDASYVYWTIWGTTAGSYNDGAIRRCAIAACNNTPELVANSGGEPTSITVDASFVYFGNHGDGSVARCPLAGCNQTFSIAPPTSGVDPRGIAVDATNVYFVSNANNTIYRCDKTNGCGSAPQVFSTNVSQPWRVVLDGSHVFASGNDIVQFALDSSAIVLATGAAARGIDVTTTDVFFAKLYAGAGTVSKCAIGGCSQNPTALVGNQNDPHDVAVDATNFYWTDNGSGDVLMCPLSGCPANPTKLASGQNTPTRIRVSSTAIFWANAGTVGNTDGSIMALAK